LIAETKVNDLPKPWAMQREGFAKNRCATPLELPLQFFVHQGRSNSQLNSPEIS
jgi:hypothetical protein